MGRGNKEPKIRGPDIFKLWKTTTGIPLKLQIEILIYRRTDIPANRFLGDIMTHRYFVVGILVLGVIALLLPGPVSGQADMLVLSGDFHQASGWGCVGMPVAGAPGIITVTADQQTSRNLVVNANSLTANPDGSIWVIPTFYSVQNSGSSRPVNYAYSGMQIAMVGDIIYVFTQNSSTQLDLNSFIITGGSSPLTANWASPKTVLFSSSGTSMSLFKVIP